MAAGVASVLAMVALAAARELDPGACAARFDVQRDKIIRTEESREMGARYLSELDVGARHECRRLCCETDACDVFVYEEKSPGSCYLFNCGPPEDFRCKFTAHSNFSSGVLALSRRLAELQDQERLAPPPAPPTPHVSTTSAPRPVVTAAPPPPTAPPVIIPMPTTSQPQGRCSRYQWECHSGGECIAVYNACDGVAQCADGSDEAPELGCPAAAPPATRTEPPPPPPLYPAQVFSQEGGGDRWPHRLLQAQPRRYQPAPPAPPAPPARLPPEAGGPHIFSHKGGLVQDEVALPAFEPPAPAPLPWPRRVWPQHAGVENGGWGGWARGEWDDRRAWPAPAPPPREPEMPAYLGTKTMPELPLVYPEQHELRDSPKKGPRPDTAPPAPAPPPPPPPPPPDNTTNKKAAAVQSETVAAAAVAPVTSVSAAHEHTHVQAASAAHARRDERAGLSERPPAAVLLLVLGILMTGATGVAVGCRARAARRRLRRGKPLAHDADYLVNGMYL